MNAVSRPSGVAVIGAGYWGRNLVRNFHALGALQTICDLDPATLARCAADYPDVPRLASADQVLADPAIGAVAIATAAETHGRLVREALLAGKDVFVEKPLCLSEEEGRRLVELAQARGRILMVGHLLWYHPAVRRMKELIDGGELGRIRYVYSSRLNIGKIRREENILWSFAPHDISVLLGLLNEEPDEVFAQGGNYLRPQVADVTVSLFSFPSGVKAHIFVSWLHPFKEQKLIVVGDRKMLVFDDVATDHKLLLYPHTIDWQHHVPVAHKVDAEPVPIGSEEPLRAECAHFLDCVQSRRPPRTDGAEGLRVLRLLQLCQRSLDTGEAQRVVPESARLPYTAHPSAFLDDDIAIGAGTQIWHVAHVLRGSRIGRDCRIGQNVVIGPDAAIGDGCKIQNNVSVYKGVTLEDHVFCGPSMVFTNVVNPRANIPRMDELRPTLVREGATLGANCTILCGVTIGRHAFVGAGAVVTRDVRDHALVVGNPARQAGWMCACGVKLRLDDTSQATCACGRRFREGQQGLEIAS